MTILYFYAIMVAVVNIFILAVAEYHGEEIDQQHAAIGSLLWPMIITGFIGATIGHILRKITKKGQL